MNSCFCHFDLYFFSLNWNFKYGKKASLDRSLWAYHDCFMTRLWFSKLFYLCHYAFWVRQGKSWALTNRFNPATYLMFLFQSRNRSPASGCRFLLVYYYSFYIVSIDQVDGYISWMLTHIIFGTFCSLLCGMGPCPLLKAVIWPVEV